MSATMRFNLIILAAVALVLVAALSAGCGPTRTVVSATPAPSATTVLNGSAVILPHESLPPLPGAMSGEASQP